MPGPVSQLGAAPPEASIDPHLASEGLSLPSLVLRFGKILLDGKLAEPWVLPKLCWLCNWRSAAMA